ncbi:hypothetical protein Taro_007589 [Colocasia esculenta]|uniref:Uncharacterized protein n=1 Tax=Colocasia esculenta TaxID=4460 RepID=A0A843TVF4_COLES|nr:hypothetical protein [Colocasia esculenta]
MGEIESCLENVPTIGLIESNRQMVDASCGGAFMTKSEDEAYNLFETLSENSTNHASLHSYERALGPVKKAELYELRGRGESDSRVEDLLERLDQRLEQKLEQKFDQLMRESGQLPSQAVANPRNNPPGFYQNQQYHQTQGYRPPPARQNAPPPSNTQQTFVQNIPAPQSQNQPIQQDHPPAQARGSQVENVKTVSTLRSGKIRINPHPYMSTLHEDKENEIKSGIEEESEENVEKEKSKGKAKMIEEPLNKTKMNEDPSCYIPRVPFPEALKPKSKNKPTGNEELLELFKQVHINILLLDAIKHGNVEKVPDHCPMPQDAAVTGKLLSSSPASGKEPRASSEKPSSPPGTTPSLPPVDTPR